MRRIAMALGLAAALVLAAAPVAGADLDSELDEVEDRMAEVRAEMRAAEAERSDLADELLAIDTRLRDLVARLETAENRLARTERRIANTEEALAELQESLQRRNQRLGTLRTEIDATRGAALDRVVDLYMQGNSEVSVFDVAEVSRFTLGLAYASRIQEVADRELARFEALRLQEESEVKRVEEEQAEMEVEAARLEERRRERATIADEVAAEAASVRSELERQQQLLDQLDDEISHFEGEIAALAREEAGIKELIRQEQSAGGTAPTGILHRPVPGGVSSGFGNRVHPIYGTVRLHTGWDMNAGCGHNIYAAESGRVFLNGTKGGYGTTVMIDHGGGMSTLYAHQSSTNVSYGQQVNRGDVIGFIGTTGVSTGCHLHFEVRINGNPVDPSAYL